MLEYSKLIEIVLTILLGWLLGLLTAPISERIRRPYRRRDLMRAVIDEMLSLQNVMAVDEIIDIVEGYHGPDRSEDFLQGIKTSRQCSEAQRAAAHHAMRKPNVGLTLPQYSIPLFVTQIADLAICDLDFQRSVLHIRYHLDLYNQLVPYTRSLSDKTFNNPTSDHRKALIANQEQGYRDAGIRAEIIMHAIGDLQKRHGT